MATPSTPLERPRRLVVMVPTRPHRILRHTVIRTERALAAADRLVERLQCHDLIVDAGTIPADWGDPTDDDVRRYTILSAALAEHEGRYCIADHLTEQLLAGA